MRILRNDDRIDPQFGETNIMGPSASCPAIPELHLAEFVAVRCQ